jgi:hypothetical protein
MKAPEYERADLLSVAIRRGTDELRAPVDRIEVFDRGARVDCWAGSRQVSFAVTYEQGGRYESEGHDGAPPSGRFLPMPGSGSWNVIVIAGPPPPGVIARLLSWFRSR